MTWTDSNLRLAAQMWADGYTGAVIGEHIGKTRNAVIGKLHREGKIGEAKANIARAVERDKATRKEAYTARARGAMENWITGRGEDVATLVG